MPDDDPEVVVRERADGATELRVNGVFVMDDRETSSERLLAEQVLAHGARTVLVGGLGLGYTIRALLDGGATRVVVAELHPGVVRAVADGAGAGPFDDHRLEVVVADVGQVVADQPAVSLDAICLDVDNGPDFLVHPGNAALYATEFLRTARAALRPGGRLVVWSMADSADLRASLAEVLEDVRADRVPVTLQGRDEAYWLLSGRAPTLGCPA